MLRAYITPTWGDEVTTTTAGTTVTRSYTYNVPVDFDIAHCEVVAFISEDQSEVYQVREVMADGGTTLLIGGLDGPATPYAAGTSGSSTAFGATFTNSLGADGAFTVTLASTDAPADWTSGFTVLGNSYTGTATVTFTNGSPAPIDITVQPGASAGVATYTLTVASVDEPNAPVLTELVHVISGVSDLVITNPQAEPHDPLYMAGLAAANQAGRAKTSRALFGGFADAAALTGVNNIYYNVSWTFPSLTDAVVAQLESFLDAGGNLMIAGQDIGWDQSGDANAYGTPTTQAFYAGHMLATYVADGSSANNAVNFTDADPVFGSLPNSGIADVFANNTYPEQITPIAPATGILTYNTGNLIGGLRAQTANYKLVYFGVGPEQMADAATGRMMIQLSHDWFYGTVGVSEFDAAIGSMGQAYPVPADGQLTIPVSGLQHNATLEVFDATGRSVFEQNTSNNGGKIVLNTSGLSDGVYSYRLRTANSTDTARSFVVSH